MSFIRANQVQVEVEKYLEEPECLEVALAAVRRDGGHAECLCAMPPRKLVVRRLAKRHVLAVWPDDGPLHDFGCAFYRDEGQDEGAGAGQQVDESADRGPVSPPPLQPAFQLTRAAKTPRLSAAGEGEQSDADAAHHGKADTSPSPAVEGPGRVSLADLMNLIWLRARLNCWAPGWTRDWWRVHREIYRKTDDVRVGSQRLDELLYVPLPFRKEPERKEIIERQWKALLSDLRPEGKAIPRRLVLAEVKALSQSEYGYKLELRNMPWPVYLNRQQWDHLQACYARALMGISRKSEPSIKLVALVLVEAAAKGKRYLNMCDATMLMASDSWIPCHTSAEVRLADAMVNGGRAFMRPMAADDTAPATPDFWLHDLGSPKPAAIEVLGVDALPYRERKLRRAAALRSAGHDVIVWDALGDEGPQLPPPKTRPA